MINATHRKIGYAALLLAALLVQIGAGPGLNSDDKMYSAIWTAETSLPDVLAWLVHRFDAWSSRLLIDVLTIAIVDHTTLWMVLNACMLTLLAVSVAALATPDARVSQRRAALAMGCLWLMPGEQTFYSLWWVTGSLNYLWPTAAALIYWAITRYRHLHGGPSRWLIVAALVAQFYASFSEQVVMTSLIVQLALMVGLRREYWRNRLLPWGLALCLAGLVLYLLAPGNAARIAASINYYFPAFADLSTAFKAYLGLSLGIYQFFYYGSWLSVIFCIALFYRFTGWPRIASMVALVIIMVFSGYMVGYPDSPHTDIAENIALVDGFYPATLERSRTAEFLGAIILGVLLAISLTLALMGNSTRSAIKHWREIRWSYPLLFVLSFIPSCMLGFSPTLYATGPRVFFISAVIIILLIAMMARPTRYYWSFLAASSVIACFTYI